MLYVPALTTELLWTQEVCNVLIKEYKEEAQCAQKGGRMLVFVICGFIKNFLTNSYLILEIYHSKSFKMKKVMYISVF